MTTITRHTGRGGSRYYLVEGDDALAGVQLPNVTSITNVLDKPALVGWAERMGIESLAKLVLDFDEENTDGTPFKGAVMAGLMEDAKGATRRIKDDAADIGTETHGIIENILTGGVPVAVPSALKSVIDSFTNWFSQSGIESIELAETMVYSAKHKYAGTIDVVARMQDGSLAIIDWKTSNGLYKETALQLAAYGVAYTEQYPQLKDPQLLAVRLGKDYPAFEVKEVTNPMECFHGFLACMGIRQWHQDMRETEWNK